MSHGDKIPDLVKDPEAEAEYEALKGLLEEDILKQIDQSKPKAKDQGSSRLVARKSTNPEARTQHGDITRNIATKSTGPHAKDWPETRIVTPYSFYGIPSEPFDPKLIKTRMAMGTLNMI